MRNKTDFVFAQIVPHLFDFNAHIFSHVSISVEDFQSFVSLSADLKVDLDSAKRLIDAQLCDFDDKGDVIVSAKGVELQRNMKIETGLVPVIIGLGLSAIHLR